MNSSNKANLKHLLNQRLTTANPERERDNMKEVISKFRQEGPAIETALVETIEASATPVELPKDTRSIIDRPKINRPISTRPGNTRAISTRPKPDRSIIAPVITSERGFLAIPHDVLDKVMPTLQPSEQVVLLYFYRLSRGFGSDRCEVGQGKIGSRCNLTRNTVKKVIRSLQEQGWIEMIEQGKGHESTVFKVNLPAARSNIDRAKTDRPETDRVKTPPQTVNHEAGSEIDRADSDPIKNMIVFSNKEPHTQTQAGVSVELIKITRRELVAYATDPVAGKGIEVPEAWINKRLEDHKADDAVREWLTRKQKPDIKNCPDCNGRGHVYIDLSDPSLGVKKCRHEKLRA